MQQPAPGTDARPAPSEEHDNLVLQPRDVAFDWNGLPLRWIPDEPMASHVINVLHLLLPEGERWFVRTFQEAIPLITDDELREQVLGFTGQEALHAEAHQGVLDHMLAHGLDPRPYVEHLEFIFHRVLGDRPGLSPERAREYLVERIAIIAGVEHFTAFLGDWVLNADGLDRAGTDPTMLDLLRWHGAEEVEHRSVAYDLLCHLDPSYVRRGRAMVISATVLLKLWVRGTRFLMAADPELHPAAGPTWRGYAQAARRGLLPDLRKGAHSVVRYFKPGYHPTQEGCTRQAVAYLGSSPAARAAAH
ncbi:MULTISPECIES: metal-dependent hydrolase [unclassified Streptomyces]|uniref:metal-dependent hydrolase n=1 Tax=unclassified Streptomyces TaxID=2593676 RepID=UPI0022B7068E|nr:MULTISPECIES: metal-dependent hydrolase [unclassified Streptomyces]MCZ7417306.1 metal-dependent hydrolase [Streptomyces sp. WMMC897]MCZ7432867.1 metal-dependent hydrolase [Streptomyces sp. WMMC1477]